MIARFRIKLLLVFLFASVAQADDRLALPSEFAGLTIASITFISSIESIEDLTNSGFPLQRGDRLSDESLAEAINSLRRRELFSHIDVEYKARAKEVEIVFLLSSRTYIAGLRFSGNSALPDRRLRRLSRIRLGDALEISRILSARDLIQNGYREEGYHSTEISIRIERRYQDIEAEIVFDVNEGYQSRIASLRLAENLPIALELLQQEMAEAAVGAPASTAEIENLRLDYLTRMRKAGFLQASLEVRERNYSALSGDIDLLVAAVPRAPMLLVFEGNQQLADDDLRKSVDFDTRTIPFTSYAVSTLARKIKELYEERGYYFAEISHTSRKDSAGNSVETVRIAEGPQVTIDEVVLQGNHLIVDADLSALMRTAPAMFWPFGFVRPGYLVRKILAEDLNVLQSYYESMGFFNTIVKSDVYHDRETNRLTVVVQIEEGFRAALAEVKLQWQGAADWSSEDPRRRLISQLTNIGPQEKYNEDLVEQERRRLEDLISKKGYPLAEVIAQFKPELQSLTFLVNTGPYVELGQIFLAGNVFTKDKVILRELAFEQGQPWDAQKIDKVEERLYKLGLFEQVSVRGSRGELKGPIEDVLVRVRERDTGVYGMSLGFNSEDGIAAGTEYAQRNIDGLGRSMVLSFKGFLKQGNRILDAGHARLTYSQPHLMDSKLELVSDLFLQFAVKLVDQFSYDRFGGTLGLRYEVDEDLELQLLYRLYYEDLFDVESMAILGPEDQGETFYAMLKPILQYDKRDDVFNPRQGYLSQLEGSLSARALGSDVDLAGVVARHTQYLPLSRSLVFAQSLCFRVNRRFSGEDVVPLSSRLFLGGRDSLRGFSRNSIGPRSADNIVVGGDSAINSMSELRYGLNENFIGVFFADLGSAYLNSSGTFEGDPLSWEDIRISPGVGIRYRTPIGPLSLDYGVALDREHGEGFGRFSIGIGAAF